MVPPLKDNISHQRNQLVSWGHWFTFANIVVAVVLASFYYLSEPLPHTLAGFGYMLVNLLSQMGFLLFFGFILSIFPLTLAIPKPGFIRGYASVVFTLVLALQVLDIYTYISLGYHLQSTAIGKVLTLLYEKYIASPVLFSAAAAAIFLAILAFELVASNLLWRKLGKLQASLAGPKVAVAFVAAFFTTHISHVWADANFYFDITRQDSVLPLSYPATAKTLLTKYDLLDEGQYLAQRNKNARFSISDAKLDSEQLVCPKSLPTITLAMLPSAQLGFYAEDDSFTLLSPLTRSNSGEMAFADALYSLPWVYQQIMISQNIKPSLISAYQGQIRTFGNWQLPADWQAEANDTAKLNLVLGDIDPKQLSKLIKQSDKVILLSQDIPPYTPGKLGYNTALVKGVALPKQDTTAISLFDLVPSLLPCEGLLTLGHAISDKTQDSFTLDMTQDMLLIHKKDKLMVINKLGEIDSYSLSFNLKLSERNDWALVIDAIKRLNKYQIKQKNGFLGTK